MKGWWKSTMGVKPRHQPRPTPHQLATGPDDPPLPLLSSQISPSPSTICERTRRWSVMCAQRCSRSSSLVGGTSAFSVPTAPWRARRPSFRTCYTPRQRRRTCVAMCFCVVSLPAKPWSSPLPHRPLTSAAPAFPRSAATWSQLTIWSASNNNGCSTPELENVRIFMLSARTSTEAAISVYGAYHRGWLKNEYDKRWGGGRSALSVRGAAAIILLMSTVVKSS